MMIELLGLSRLEALHERAKPHEYDIANEIIGARLKLKEADAIREEVEELERLESVSQNEVAESTDAAEGAGREEKEAADKLAEAIAATDKLAGDRLLLEGARRELDAAASNLTDAEAVPERIRHESERRLRAVIETVRQTSTARPA